MRKIIVFPSKYIQSEGELLNIAESIKHFGSKPLIIATPDSYKRIKSTIIESIKDKNIELIVGSFNGECTMKEITRLGDIAIKNKCDVIIGIGGGKTIDVTKAVSHFKKIPVIIVPTIASTDAPCSSLTVIYNDKGEFEKYLVFDKNPDIVLVDTGIIAKAPTRFLVAGMGDALATFFEARACHRSFSLNVSKGHSTNAAMGLAQLCYETLLEDSLKAKIASNCNVVTPAFENVIEANILLSGLGFESCGLACAHAIHNGCTVLTETHKYLHGEKVSFGVIVQLVLENSHLDEFNEVLNFCKSVGLPTCLADIGVIEVIPEKVRAVAKACVAAGESIYNMPFKVTEDEVYSAIITADKLGS